MQVWGFGRVMTEPVTLTAKNDAIITTFIVGVREGTDHSDGYKVYTRGPLAEAARDRLVKGMGIFIAGRLSSNVWQEGGKEMRRPIIRASKFYTIHYPPHEAIVEEPADGEVESAEATTIA